MPENIVNNELQALYQEYKQLPNFRNIMSSTHDLFISTTFLLAGFIRETKLVEFASSRLGATTGKLNHGEVLATLLLGIRLGKLCRLADHPNVDLSDIPLNVYLDLASDIGLNDFQRVLLTETLPAIRNYGCSKFFNEFAAHAINTMLGKKLAPTSVSLGATAINFFTRRDSKWDYARKNDSDHEKLERTHGAIFLTKECLTK